MSNWFVVCVCVCVRARVHARVYVCVLCALFVCLFWGVGGGGVFSSGVS